jgi:hypothetical protein
LVQLAHQHVGIVLALDHAHKENFFQKCVVPSVPSVPSGRSD